MVKWWYFLLCKCFRVLLYWLFIIFFVCLWFLNLWFLFEFVVIFFEFLLVILCLFLGSEDGWVLECNVFLFWLSFFEEIILFWYCCLFWEFILEGWSLLEIIFVCFFELLFVCLVCWFVFFGFFVDWKFLVKGFFWKRGFFLVFDCLYFWEYFKYCLWWWFKFVGIVLFLEVFLMWLEEGFIWLLYVLYV